jgi:hypothetical protein
MPYNEARPFFMPLFIGMRGRDPTASVRLLRCGFLQVFLPQHPEDALPKALLYPQLVAPVGALPLAALLGVRRWSHPPMLYRGARV